MKRGEHGKKPAAPSIPPLSPIPRQPFWNALTEADRRMDQKRAQSSAGQMKVGI